MDVKRYVNMGFVLGGLLAWICLAPLFGWIIELVSPVLDKPIIGAEFRVSNLLGLVAAIGLTAYIFMRDDIYTQALEIGNELSKVTWPKWPETRTSTIVVIITTLIIASILGLFDFVWAKVTGLIYGLGA
ncbi:MAG: preprotein translocase subunit SecE [Myxococcota bacterium]|jgi:preprotein translocase subunit SecE